MAQVNLKTGYGVEVINGETHVYCMQQNGKVIDHVMQPGKNTLTMYNENNHKSVMTIDWSDVDSGTSFIAVGNSNDTFSYEKLSRIESSEPGYVYAYLHSGNSQTAPGGFEKMTNLLEEIAEANGIEEPRMATAGYSGSGPAAYTSARDINNVSYCLLSDPISDLGDFKSGDNVKTLVITSYAGNCNQRIQEACTKNTFIIELNATTPYVHKYGHGLVGKYGLADFTKGTLDMVKVSDQLKADGWDFNIVYFDENGKRHETKNATEAQTFVEQLKGDDFADLPSDTKNEEDDVGLTLINVGFACKRLQRTLSGMDEHIKSLTGLHGLDNTPAKQSSFLNGAPGFPSGVDTSNYAKASDCVKTFTSKLESAYAAATNLYNTLDAVQQSAGTYFQDIQTPPAGGGSYTFANNNGKDFGEDNLV